MALRASAPIYVAQSVLNQAKVAFGSNNPLPQMEPQPAEQGEGAQGEGEESASEEESQEKDFAGVSKDKWEELLSNLDPDDFKYKM
jgi:bifunctional DNase/RNase